MEIAWIVPAAWAAMQGAGVAGDFLKRTLGPLGDALGKDLAAWYSERGQRTRKVAEDAAAMLHEAGYEAQQVPGRVLLPLLEYASLEEEPELSRRWSALLANAASPTSANEILPGYAEVLRQLTPLQAQILDWMYDSKTEIAFGIFNWMSLERKEVEGHFGLTADKFALLVTDLHRLLLIHPSGQQFRDAYEPVYREIALTAFGLSFVRACRAPEPSR